MAGRLAQAAGCFPQPAEAHAPAPLCCPAWEAGREGWRRRRSNRWLKDSDIFNCCRCQLWLLSVHSSALLM